MVRLSSVQAVFRIIPRVLCEVPPQVPQPGISHTNSKSQFLFRRPRCNAAGLTFPPPAPLFAVGLGMTLPPFILLSPSFPAIRKQGRLLAGRVEVGHLARELPPQMPSFNSAARVRGAGIQIRHIGAAMLRQK